MSWQDDRRNNAAECIINYIDAGVDSAMNVHGCSREEAEDFAIDYLMASRCGEVEKSGPHGSGSSVWMWFECPPLCIEVSEEYSPEDCRNQAACHWAAARWLEDRQK